MISNSRGVLLAAALLCACHPAVKAPPSAPPPAPADVNPAMWAGLSRVEAQALRAALMRAQVEVAQHLVYERAGAAAAAHIARAVSELYAPAKADYAARNLSIDEAAFLQASAAAGAGATSKEMRPYTNQLLDQISKLEPPDRQWSKPGAVKRLLTELSNQYGEAVQGGFVVNEARYQDAYGLAIVAQEIIDDAVKDGAAKDPRRAPELEREAEGLVNMFPSASAPKSPADAGELLSQINRVQLAFPGME